MIASLISPGPEVGDLWSCGNMISTNLACLGHGWTATSAFRVLRFVFIKAMILAAGASEDATGDRDVFGSVGVTAQAIPDVEDLLSEAEEAEHNNEEGADGATPTKAASSKEGWAVWHPRFVDRSCSFSRSSG